MEILLVYDQKFAIDKTKICLLLNAHSNSLHFTTGDDVVFDSDILTRPNSFDCIIKQVEKRKTYDEIFCFTDLQYDNNYFFTYKREYPLGIFSFSGWNLLTTLPKSNGILYFIVDLLSRHLNNAISHQEVTGCIYDFLEDKTGVDIGMRMAAFCPSCLNRLTGIFEGERLSVFEDLKTLMNLLSNASKWEEDILKGEIADMPPTIKRNLKKTGEIHVVIASPSDTQDERERLLNELERKFRINGYEKQCNNRVIVHGWEELASQAGNPQDVINAQLIRESDIVIAIIKHKLGTPTVNTETGEQRAESGTVEELMSCIDNNSINSSFGMLYFYADAPAPSFRAPDYNSVKENWDKVEAFKEKIKHKMLWREYVNIETLLDMVARDIVVNVESHFMG
jgi:hypothetical protein